MKEDDRFIPFFEAYKDDFFESMEDVRMYLKNRNLWILYKSYKICWQNKEFIIKYKRKFEKEVTYNE